MTELTQTPNYRSKEESMAYVLAELREGTKVLVEVVDKESLSTGYEDVSRVEHPHFVSHDGKWLDDVDAKVVSELIKEGRLCAYREIYSLNESCYTQYYRLADEKQN